MKKMTNGKDVRFVADALVSAYRNRGYHVEDEEVAPPPSGDPEKHTAPDGQTNSEGQTNPEGQGASEGQTAPEDTENATGETAGDPENQTADQFACPVCGKAYAKKAYLEKHMAEKHNQ